MKSNISIFCCKLPDVAADSITKAKEFGIAFTELPRNSIITGLCALEKTMPGMNEKYELSAILTFDRVPPVTVPANTSWLAGLTRDPPTLRLALTEFSNVSPYELLLASNVRACSPGVPWAVTVQTA